MSSGELVARGDQRLVREVSPCGRQMSECVLRDAWWATDGNQPSRQDHCRDKRPRACALRNGLLPSDWDHAQDSVARQLHFRWRAPVVLGETSTEAHHQPTTAGECSGSPGQTDVPQG